MSFGKTKLTSYTDEILKDFLSLLSGDIPDLSFFCFVPPNYLVLMNGQELKVCSLLNVSCSDSVADVALLGWW